MRKDITVDTVLIAIRSYCLECSGDSRKQVERCNMKNCHLYPYRNVNAIGGSEMQKPLKNQISMFDLAKKESGENGKGKRKSSPRNDKRAGTDR